MKKNRLLSLFLALVMLFGVVSALGATASAADDFRAWISDGKLYWDACEGATHYTIYETTTESGWLRVVRDLKHSDMPVNLTELLKNIPNGNLGIIVGAEILRSNGTYAEIGTSNWLEYVHNNSAVRKLETPFGYWDGTSICWKKMDLAEYEPYGATSDNIEVEIYLLENNVTLTREYVNINENNWDVSDYIEIPTRMYNFEMRFVPKSNSSTNLYHSDKFYGTAVTGQALIDGYSNGNFGALSGTVTITPANPKPGDTLTANLSGELASIPASKINYYWQHSDDPSSGVFIGSGGGPTGNTYTIPAGDIFNGWGFRVRVTADGYDGELYSNTVTVGYGSPSYPKGDVDRSGQVGNSDLIMVARHVVHIITLSGEQFTLGDMDNDNVIDNKDIISVARKVVGL